MTSKGRRHRSQVAANDLAAARAHPTPGKHRSAIPHRPTTTERLAAVQESSRHKVRDNERNERTEKEHSMPEPTITLAVLAIELDQPIATLARRLDGAVSIDPVSGLRVIPAATARSVIDEHTAAQARAQERHQRQRAELAARSNPAIRVKAIAANQQARRNAGLIDGDMSSYEVMASGDRNSRLEAAGRRFDDMLVAGNRGDVGTLTTFHPQKKG